MSTRNIGRAGFTIVELIIVIVVIAILATIVTISYNGAKAQANDARRMKDIRSIAEMIEVYQTRTGSFPAPVGSPGASGWEVSAGTSGPNDFLSVLRTSGLIPEVPLDPQNTRVSAVSPSRNSANYEYFYYRYAAGSFGCDSAKGEFYVVGVTRMDTVASGANAPENPGFDCLPAGRDWSPAGAYVTGGYANG